MRASGIIRKPDAQGRILLPIEIRRNLQWDNTTGLEIFSDSNGVFLQKHEKGCVFCGSDKDVHTFEKKKVCKNCIERLKK